MAETPEQKYRRLGLAAPQGQAPDAAQYRQALATARARARATAAQALPAGGPPPAPEALAAYEQALARCLDLTLLGVELARSHGPAFLPGPDEAP